MRLDSWPYLMYEDLGKRFSNFLPAKDLLELLLRSSVLLLVTSGVVPTFLKSTSGHFMEDTTEPHDPI